MNENEVENLFKHIVYFFGILYRTIIFPTR